MLSKLTSSMNGTPMSFEGKCATTNVDDMLNTFHVLINDITMISAHQFGMLPV